VLSRSESRHSQSFIVGFRSAKARPKFKLQTHRKGTRHAGVTAHSRLPLAHTAQCRLNLGVLAAWNLDEYPRLPRANRESSAHVPSPLAGVDFIPRNSLSLEFQSGLENGEGPLQSERENDQANEGDKKAQSDSSR
jgi:hypothetical protein